MDLCAACEADLIPNQQACYQCAIPLPAAETNPQIRCGECLKAPPNYTHTLAPYLYQWPLDRLIQAFKFQGNLAIGRTLAGLLQKHIQHSSGYQPSAVLMPIPLHPKRQQQRGFNQTALLAADLARLSKLALLEDSLLRLKSGSPQSELDAKARKQNIKGAFGIDPKTAAIPEHVILIDDVMTTGSTFSEAARVLLAGGAKRVDCWAIARAPKT